MFSLSNPLLSGSPGQILWEPAILMTCARGPSTVLWLAATLRVHVSYVPANNRRRATYRFANPHSRGFIQ